jgi:hypothetical protein
VSINRSQCSGDHTTGTHIVRIISASNSPFQSREAATLRRCDRASPCGGNMPLVPIQLFRDISKAGYIKSVSYLAKGSEIHGTHRIWSMIRYRAIEANSQAFQSLAESCKKLWRPSSRTDGPVSRSNCSHRRIKRRIVANTFGQLCEKGTIDCHVISKIFYL